MARSGVPPVSANVNENAVATKLHSIALHSVGGLLGQLAGRDIVLPAVPGATDERSVEIALSEGASVMQAYAIDGKEFTVNVRDGDGLPGYVEFADLPGRDFVDFGRVFECHWFASPYSLAMSQPYAARPGRRV